MGKITALYSRVSTQEQAREGYSIDEQSERLEKYCGVMGWKKFKQYVDAGFSGGSKNRPALQEMISDIREGKVERVVVYKLDRLSRSQKDTLELIEDDFLKNGCDFISISENFDTSSSFGRAMIGILAVFAQLEREQIKERLSIGKEGRAKSGKYHGGVAPAGYDLIDGNLIINEYEALQIREVHKLYQKGLNYREINRYMNEKGYSTKTGGWDPKKVKYVLQNRVYIGYISHKGVEYKGSHEPIIPEEVYEKTMEILSSKDFSKYKNNGNSSLLSGMLFCGRCGARYARLMVSTGGKRYGYYLCHSKWKDRPNMIKDANCKNKNYREEVLDKAILDEVRKLELDSEYIEELRNGSGISEEIEEKEKALADEVEKLKRQRSRLLDLYISGSFEADILEEKEREINIRIEKLECQINDLRAKEPRLSKDEAQEAVKNFSDILERGTKKEVKLILESLIDRIEIDGDNITIFWSFT